MYNNKENDINGRHGFFTNCHSFVTVETIRSGKFKIPEDTLLKSSNSAPRTDSNGFVDVPDGTDEEIPF